MNNYTEELKRILKSSELIAESLNSSNINSIHFIMSMLSNYNSLSKILEKYKIKTRRNKILLTKRTI